MGYNYTLTPLLSTEMRNDFCREHLDTPARIKKPRGYYVVDKTPSRTVQRAEIASFRKYLDCLSGFMRLLPRLVHAASHRIPSSKREREREFRSSPTINTLPLTSFASPGHVAYSSACQTEAIVSDATRVRLAFSLADQKPLCELCPTRPYGGEHTTLTVPLFWVSSTERNKRTGEHM